jgi:hypothetical protein
MAFEDFWFSAQAAGYTPDEHTFSTNYLTRTLPSMAGVNQVAWTQSIWFRRSALAPAIPHDQYLMGCNYIPTENYYFLGFPGGSLPLYPNNTLAAGDYFRNGAWIWYDPGSATFTNTSTTSNLINVVVHYDSNNPVPADRAKVWIDGVLVTAFGPYGEVPPTLGQTSWWTDTLGGSGVKYIGASGTVGGTQFYGEMADIFYVNGALIPPSTFGQTSGANWVPQNFTTVNTAILGGPGFGADGFSLNFNPANKVGVTWLDQSGNGNNWTQV